jgi:hypothetical protein
MTASGRIKFAAHIDRSQYGRNAWSRSVTRWSPPRAFIRPPPLVLRNGSARDRPLPQVLEAQKHGEHPFELSIEMDLVAAEPLQLVGIK